MQCQLLYEGKLEVQRYVWLIFISVQSTILLFSIKEESSLSSFLAANIANCLLS